mmetsp:Transcript_31615/g.48048  ORF Transcript_31615/g.48048 Transcript_31615/m.48048 type:complete len:163 (+) Transcript_31615:172-660(+)
MPRPRMDSFAEIDESQASAVLTKLLQENNVMLGGSSMGRGLKRAARFYIQNGDAHRSLPNHFDLPGANDLNPDVLRNPTEESFYVVDIGVIVSQLYQWRKYFPRVEPFYAVKVRVTTAAKCMPPIHLCQGYTSVASTAADRLNQLLIQTLCPNTCFPNAVQS